MEVVYLMSLCKLCLLKLRQSNSHPLTTDVLSDVTSLAPLSPVNLLTMKSKVVMPPPGDFTPGENTGEESNICPMNFGTDGERRCY